MILSFRMFCMKVVYASMWGRFSLVSDAVSSQGFSLSQRASFRLRCSLVSGGARDFFLQVLWGCSAFYRGCYEISVIAYVSHGSLLQHLPTISSHMFTRLLTKASLGSIKSAIQIDRIIIIIRLLPTDAHIAVFLCDGH